MNFSFLFFENRVSSRGLRVVLLLWFLFSIPMEVLPNPLGRAEKRFYAFEFLSFRDLDLGEKTFLEIFCQIPTDNLIFIKFKDGFFASYELAISLHGDLGNEVARQSFIDSVKVKTFKDIHRPRIPKLIRFKFSVKAGQYEARMRLTDLETRKGLDFSRRIAVSDYTISDLQVSDLEIATSISISQEENVLVKNNRRIVPNVARIVGGALKVLYIYSEIYNLQYSSREPNKSFKATYLIQNERGSEIKAMERIYEKPGDTCALVAGIPVSRLESGAYKLILIVEDLDNGQRTQKNIRFLVIDSDSKIQSLSELSGENSHK